jgi:hypothetical protein
MTFKCTYSAVISVPNGMPYTHDIINPQCVQFALGDMSGGDIRDIPVNINLPSNQNSTKVTITVTWMEDSKEYSLATNLMLAIGNPNSPKPEVEAQYQRLDTCMELRAAAKEVIENKRDDGRSRVCKKSREIEQSIAYPTATGKVLVSTLSTVEGMISKSKPSESIATYGEIISCANQLERQRGTRTEEDVLARTRQQVIDYHHSKNPNLKYEEIVANVDNNKKLLCSNIKDSPQRWRQRAQSKLPSRRQRSHTVSDSSSIPKSGNNASHPKWDMA